MTFVPVPCSFTLMRLSSTPPPRLPAVPHSGDSVEFGKFRLRQPGLEQEVGIALEALFPEPELVLTSSAVDVTVVGRDLAVYDPTCAGVESAIAHFVVCERDDGGRGVGALEMMEETALPADDGR